MIGRPGLLQRSRECYRWSSANTTDFCQNLFRFNLQLRCTESEIRRRLEVVTLC